MSAELQDQFENETWYHAAVEDVRFDESPGSNTPGITIKWTVTDGAMQGKNLIDNRWISKKNVERQVKDFEVLGFDLKKTRLSKLPDAIRGKIADVLCRLEEFPKGSGVKTPKVGRIKPPGAGGEDKLIARLEDIIGSELREQDEWEKDKKF